MAEKLYYTMGEVAEMFDVNQSLIRHWETHFKELKPKRNKKGNRLFTAKDVDYLKLIYHLVKERGMTLDGAAKVLKEHRDDGSLSREAELMERLQKIRSMLMAVREDLKIHDNEVDLDVAVTPQTLADDPFAEEEAQIKTAGAKPQAEGEVKERELFAFYEQSLF